MKGCRESLFFLLVKNVYVSIIYLIINITKRNPESLVGKIGFSSWGAYLMLATFIVMCAALWGWQSGQGYIIFIISYFLFFGKQLQQTCVCL